jgi:hypothetical protein
MSYTRLRDHEWEKPPWEFKIASGYGGRFKDAGVSFGFNDAIGTAAFEDIWTVGGNYTFLSDPETLDVSSDSALDTDLGSGAHQIKITGLDSNFDLITEDVTLSGLVPVTTENSFTRVIKIRAMRVGAGGVNVGNILVVSSDTALTLGRVDPGLGQALMAITTIPRGFCALITGVQASSEGVDSIVVDFQFRQPGESWVVGHRLAIPSGGVDTVNFMRFLAPRKLPPLSDFKVRGVHSTGGGTTTIAATFSYYLIDEREVLPWPAAL